MDLNDLRLLQDDLVLAKGGDTDAMDRALTTVAEALAAMTELD